MIRAHLDLQAGIAGDMFLAACLDLGLSRRALASALESLKLNFPWAHSVRRGSRGGVGGLRFRVEVPGEQGHRGLREILAIIGRSSLPKPVRQRAEAMFRTLAEAEGKVHGIPPEAVHFHEVGATDAIIDLCGAAFAIWKLGMTEVTASAAPLGGGSVTCHHGTLPVPVPAVVEIFRRHRIPVAPHDGLEGERVTPTGAAILAHLVDDYGGLRLTRIDRVGHGLGSRELAGRPNLLRILVEEKGRGGERPGVIRDRVALLSTHIDDMNPEWYGPLWERLQGAGVLDVALMPITMKKGRPATRLEVIVAVGQEGRVARLLLEHTTTLGVRVAEWDRFTLERAHERFTTPWGDVRAVVAGGLWRLEFEDLARIARTEGWSLPLVQQRLMPFLEAARERHSPRGG
ncbi:MAG: nickel pincer cofactor biosynthesis protein LarC [Magnetococcales bacterium]|nr:nickel pincer cofactor biosynthesis protein LarC [Magnetococcales bacterium]